MKTIGRIYLVFLVVTLFLAFMFAVPSMKAQQMAACDMVESGMGQINPQANYQYPPMTAEKCQVIVENAWFNRAFIGVVGSMVVAALATPLVLFGLSSISTAVLKATNRRKPTKSSR